MSNSQSKIEDFAFDYLQNYYVVQQSAKNILVGKFETTKKGAVVDGLLAFKDRDSSMFVATVSFKENDKLVSLLTLYKKSGLSKLRYFTSVILFVLAVLLVRNADIGSLSWVVPFVAALLGYILHSFVEKFYLKRKIKHWVDNLKQFRANEQWIGMSISSLYFRNNSLATYLLKLCQRRGIGLITVGKRSKVVLMQEPRTSICRHGDFLSYYKTEDNIRKALEKDTVLRVA